MILLENIKILLSDYNVVHDYCKVVQSAVYSECQYNCFQMSKYFLVNIMSSMTTVKLYSQQFTVNVNISFKYQNTSE